MQLRRLTAVLLVMVTGAGIALFLFSRLAVAELLALAMLGVFWVLLPVLFLSAITWTYVRDRLRSRGIVREELSHEQAGHAGR